MNDIHNRLERYFARLKTPRIETDREAGRRLGIHWAESIATIDELECLEIFRNRLQSTGNWPGWFYPSSPRPWGWLKNLWHFAVIDPHGANIPGRVPAIDNRNSAAQFWKSAGVDFDQYESRGEFLLGFSDGALTVWDKLIDRWGDHLKTDNPPETPSN